MARICSNEEVVGDLDEGRFCAMACPETRLKGFIELMVGHVLLELGSNCSFQDFAQERKVKDMPVVMSVIWVQTWLLEDGGD